MGDDFLAQLSSLSSGVRGNNENYQPMNWGGMSSPGDSGGNFGGMGGGGQLDILGKLKSIFGGGSGSGGGWLQGAATGADALSKLGGLYLGIKQLGLAQDSFGLQKKAYNTNLRNQTQSYNTQVSDRINGRSYNTEEERQAALKAAQLPSGG